MSGHLKAKRVRGSTLSAALGGAATDEDPEEAWAEIAEGCLRSIRARLKPNTVRYYQQQLRLLLNWLVEQGIGPSLFKPIHLERYTEERLVQGVSRTTCRHDIVAAKRLTAYAAKSGALRRDPLKDYTIPKAPRASVHCPTDEEICRLLAALEDRWNTARNPGIKNVDPAKRTFYKARNGAIVTGLLDTACRAGEMLNLRLGDVEMEKGQITIRETKNGQPRTVPVSAEWREALAFWLRRRPAGAQTDHVFVDLYGDPVSAAAFGAIFRGYLEWADLKGFSLHGLRHYAITQIAKTNVWAAAEIAGHRDLQVTRQYLHADADHLKEAHTLASPLGRLMYNRRSERQKEKKERLI